jgi:UDP-N-acetylglucosamine--N-acetylmuramyl-(pentapeptide) pyrophosphoryl-undecaprenol N-acetylglucosamine transferase
MERARTESISSGAGLVVIAAGGTGGHFYPAEALAGELASRGHEIALMCDARSGGTKSAVFAGHDRFVLRGAGIAGRGVVRGAAALAGLAMGTLQARAILTAKRPAAIVGFGGYPSVAPALAAATLGRRPRVILHEQNAVLGRANRMLSKRADVLALSFADTALVPRDVWHVMTGNPVRPAIAALANAIYAAPSGNFDLLVLGGSLGARVFSDVVPAAVASLPALIRSRLRITQQCRAEDLERVRAAYADCGMAPDLSPFFADVARLLGRAHLVIARAGASTVAELAVSGRPSILVPLPHAIDDHQTANARALAAAGGAWVIPQPQFDPDKLVAMLLDLIGDPARLAGAHEQAAARGRADATRRLADLVEQTIEGETRT